IGGILQESNRFLHRTWGLEVYKQLTEFSVQGVRPGGEMGVKVGDEIIFDRSGRSSAAEQYKFNSAEEINLSRFGQIFEPRPHQCRQHISSRCSARLSCEGNDRLRTDNIVRLLQCFRRPRADWLMLEGDTSCIADKSIFMFQMRPDVGNGILVWLTVVCFKAFAKLPDLCSFVCNKNILDIPFVALEIDTIQVGFKASASSHKIQG